MKNDNIKHTLHTNVHIGIKTDLQTELELISIIVHFRMY